MDSLAEEDPTLPVHFGESINTSQLPNVTIGGDITTANFNDHFPDTSVQAVQKVGSGRMSPVRTHTMKEYEQQIAELKKENFSLKLRIYFMEERMQQKFEDNDDIKTNIELKIEVESLKKELTEQQQLLVKASTAVESLAHEKDVHVEKLKEAENSCNRLRDQLEAKCQRIQQELEELQRENDGLQDKLKNSTTEQENLKDVLHSNKMTSCKQQEIMGEAQTEKDMLIDQLHGDLKARDQMIGKLNDEKVQTAQKTIQPLLEEVQKLKGQLQEKQDQIDDLVKDGEKARNNDKDKIRKQYEDIYHEQEKRVHELEEAAEQLQDDVRDKTKAMKDMENALKVSQKVIKELDGKIKDKEGDIISLESGARKRDKAIQGLTDTVRSKDKEIRQLCDQIEDMEEALMKANEALHKAEKKKYEGMEPMQSSLSELEEKLADMRAKIQAKDLENERLQRSLARKQHEVDHLKGELQDAEDQIDSAAKLREDDIKQLKDQLQDAKAKANDNAELVEAHYQAQQTSTEVLLQDLKDKLVNKDKELQEASKDKIKAEEAKDCELRSLKQALRDQQKDLDRARADNMDDANRLGELESKVKDLDNKNKQLSDSINALHKANQNAEESHKRGIREKDSVIDRLQAAVAGKERELEEEKEVQQRKQEHSGMVQDAAVRQLNDRLKDKEKQLEEIVAERAQVAAANARATQDLLQTIRDKDGQIKDLNDKCNRALVDKANAIRDLQRQVNEKEFEVQNAEDMLNRADQEQGMLLAKMRNALAEKDKTIEKLLDSGREKDRLFLEMQQAAVRTSPSPSHSADMSRLKDDNERMARELDRTSALLREFRSQQPDKEYVESLKEELNHKNKLLAKAKESVEALREDQEAERSAKQSTGKLRRKIQELEDELLAQQDRIDALNSAAKVKDNLITELRLENTKITESENSPCSDSSDQLQMLLQQQIHELSRLTSALNTNFPLNVNITHQSEMCSTRSAGSHDGEMSGNLREQLGAELLAMQSLRRQMVEGMGSRSDCHDHNLRVMNDRQGIAQSAATSGVGSGVGSDNNDVSPAITTASESQRRSFGVGHDLDTIPTAQISHDTGLHIPVPQRDISLEALADPTVAATKDELRRELVDQRVQLKEAKGRQQSLENQLEQEELESLRSIPGHDLADPTTTAHEELQDELADLRCQLQDARRRHHLLEKRLEREELESLRSIPGQEQDGDSQVIVGLQRDLGELREKLRDSQRETATLKQQLDAALLNQVSSDSSGDHVVPILKQQLDQAKSLLEEKNHKLIASEQQNAALRHHLGISCKSLPDSGRSMDNPKLESKRLASQLQEEVGQEQDRVHQMDYRTAQTQTLPSANTGSAQVALLQKKLEKAKNLTELLKRHIRLNGAGVEGQESNFNPELIVDMAREIERLRGEVESSQGTGKQVRSDEIGSSGKATLTNATSVTQEKTVDSSFMKQLEKAQMELNATKRRFKALTLKLHATEGTVHQQAERIKRYRRRLHNIGVPAPGTPKRVSSDSNLMNSSVFLHAHRRISAASLSQVPSSDEDRESTTSSASLTQSEQSASLIDATFAGYGLSNDTEELKEQVVVLKKQLKRCRHVIRKLQSRMNSVRLSRPSSPSHDPSNSNAWFELVANREAFERLQQDLENVTSQLERVMDANSLLQERNAELLTELIELQTQKQNSFSEEVIRSQEMEIGRLHEQLAELRSLMGVLTNMLAEALKILKGLEKDNKTAMQAGYSEQVHVIEERLRDGSEVVDTIKKLLGDQSHFGRRQGEDEMKELFSDRLRIKDEQMQQLRDEIRGQQKLNRELQEILHNKQLKADAAREELKREHKKEIIILQEKLEESKKETSKSQDESKSSFWASSGHTQGQGNTYLHETNIRLTTENESLQNCLAQQEDRAHRLKAELDRANTEIKKLHVEKQKVCKEKQRLQEQFRDNEQLANSLRFELSVYEQLHTEELRQKFHSQSPGSPGKGNLSRGGEGSPSSTSHVRVIDRTTGVDLSELLQELRHLRIQLERSIDTNNALRIMLEEALGEKKHSSPSSNSLFSKDSSPTHSKGSSSSHPKDKDSMPHSKGSSHSPSSKHASASPRTTMTRTEEIQFLHSNSSRNRAGENSIQGSSKERVRSSRKLFQDFTPLPHQPGTTRQHLAPQADLGEGDMKEIYAVSMVTTYEAVSAGVQEAAIIGGAIDLLLREKLSNLAQVVEESSPHARGSIGTGETESSELVTITTLSKDIQQLLKFLDTSRRHLVNFWTTDRLVQHQSQSDEVKELRKRLGAQEKLMQEARDRLAATNREKESMEEAIIRQLCRTNDVIRKAKGNLQSAEA